MFKHKQILQSSILIFDRERQYTFTVLELQDFPVPKRKDGFGLKDYHQLTEQNAQGK